MDATDRPVMTSQEFAEALEGLSATDRIRLIKIASKFAYGIGMEPDDLLHEAIVSTLSQGGGRNCPQGVNILVFLKNAMKGISSNIRTKRRPNPIDRADSFDEVTDSVMNEPRSFTPTPEQEMIDCDLYEKSLSKIEAIFADDPQAMAVLMGDLEGWSAEEVQELEDMTEKEYDAARKRRRRKLEKTFSKGWLL